MLTFEEVRERVTPQLAHEYAGPGTFYIAPWGFQDGDEFVLLVGAREAIVDDRLEFATLDDVQILADRRTGILRKASALDRLGHTLKPVGNWALKPDESP